jgi:SagB-type dehydrogenase family enzyme
VSLEAAMATRRSVRELANDPLSRAELGQLLWAAQGITDEEGRRTVPSAGATYPLDVLVATEEGVARYVPDGHRLAWLGATDVRAALRMAAGDQAVVGEAAAVIVISGVVERTAPRYGERAERCVTLEAGHATQNVLLQAIALELGAVPVGSFDDAEVHRVLGLATGEAPLYLVPVGHPR